MPHFHGAWAEIPAHAGRWVQRHPKSLTAVITVALAGFGATAFGIAPMVPDASDLPRRTIVESVAPESLDKQLDALAEHALELHRSDLTRTSDTADSLLKRLGVSDPQAATFFRTDPVGRKLLEGRGGKMVRAKTDENGALTELVARYAPPAANLASTHFVRLGVERVGGTFRAHTETAPLTTEVKLGSGTVRASLFGATDEARIPDSVAVQLAEVFASDFDLRRELKKGDTFAVVYEALSADGEPITWNATGGRLLAADFMNAGKRYSAVWFKNGSGKGAYYGFDGQNKRRSFLSSPVEFSRVTSGFEMRMHPILNTWKQHNGVDYGAPTGTPVRSIGDGEVDFAGWQNGYGNVVEIRHSNQRSTLYAHLSRIDVTRGQRVDQGTTLGTVGSTGWATGPHLHFELKLAGVQQDPMQIAKSSDAVALDPVGKALFMATAKGLKAQLELADSVAAVAGGIAGE